MQVPSTACDITSFNGQWQLFLLTCAEWRDFSNHTKRQKNNVTLTWKFLWKSCSTTHLPFLSSNPKILKAFPKMKPTKCQAKEKKWGKKSEKRGEEKKWKVILKTAVSLLNPKTITKFCFLHMPKLRKLIFCIWIRRSQSVQPVNNFMVGLSSL